MHDTQQRLGEDKPRPSAPLRVAQYVRMSTDLQQYSIDNQTVAIKRYVDQRGMVLVRSYADPGKSGLDLQGRPGLRGLLNDVLGGQAPYEALIVYDVSRWGRFQDIDESAHYEYLCRRAGIRVIYCAEPFENDGTPLGAVLKTLKRAMAAEYSRELSTKTHLGQCRFAEQGFHQGGPAGLGLRRLLIDQHGRSRRLLQAGEHKALISDRVVLVPGPTDEVCLVQRIFHLFTVDGLRSTEIATLLSTEGVATVRGGPWSHCTIMDILKNEKYIGNSVFNRTSTRLKSKRVVNPPDLWVRKSNAFPQIVAAEMFSKAQAIIQGELSRRNDDYLLQSLRQLYERVGTLNTKLIDAEPGIPTTKAYAWRFGSLNEAYKRVGFFPWDGRQKRQAATTSECPNDAELLASLKHLLERTGRLTAAIIDAEAVMPSSKIYEWRFRGLTNAYRLIGYRPRSMQSSRGRRPSRRQDTF
ncbi:MAG: recombinase family protein [Caulobacteraceae bacterium]|nr:recombinase family protein [Caulobacteraceae bacterium]